jgi:serine-type D-Ala-D-Ala carboxypeptidase/endopeptidase
MKNRLYLMALCLTWIPQEGYPQKIGQRDAVAKAIDRQGRAFVGNRNISSVSVGVFRDGRKYTRHFGELEKGKGNRPNDGTIYEIGSVTKTLTGYLVARAVKEGKISLDQDVRSYLRGDYPNLEFNEQPVTVRHLLTHTGGLPMTLPMELKGVFENLDGGVPLRYQEIEKSYDREKFLADLKGITLDSEPGTGYSYSNVGAELLGCVLESLYSKPMDALIGETFNSELGMPNTAVELDNTQKEKLAKGYWMGNATPSPNQLNTLWASAGGVKMDMTDMLRYIEVQLTGDNPVVSESHRVLYEGHKTLRIAYFWRVRNDRYGTSYNHHGGTSGTQNWLFIFPGHRLGISIITNQSGPGTPKLLGKAVNRMLREIVKD